MRTILIVACLLWNASVASAFSPYEQYLMSGAETHVGLIAELKPGQRQALVAAIRRLAEKPLEQRVKAAHVKHLQAFTRKIEGKEYAVFHFAYRGGTGYLNAATDFENATAAIDWKAIATPLPLAQAGNRIWLQMEWINFIRGLDVQRQPTSTQMIGTTVLAEKEMEYRTLHQTVWPGVVDQIARANSRNLTVFLVELGNQLVEFLYVEYMGSDAAKDEASNRSHAINHRWWKLTDACQKPFSDVDEGIWATLEPLINADER